MSRRRARTLFRAASLALAASLPLLTLAASSPGSAPFSTVAAVPNYLLTDPVLGWRLEPGASVEFKAGPPHEQARGRVTINSLGHRSPEPDGQPYDVLMVGDSFAFGALVDDAETPAAQLGKLGVRAYSLGVGGYSPVQEVEALRRAFAAGIRAARVVWCLYENDLLWPGTWESRLIESGPGGRFLGASFPGGVSGDRAALALGYVLEGRALALEHGATFAVLVLPSKEELAGLKPETQAAADGLARLGVPVSAVPVEAGDFWSWDPHYNAAGYLKVARAAKE